MNDNNEELNKYQKMAKLAAISRKKNTLQKYIDMGLTYDYLYDEYIVKNRSLQSLADEHEVKVGFIRTVLRVYEINKSSEAIREKARINLQKVASDPNRKKATKEQLRAAQLKGTETRNANRDKKLAEEGITYDSLFDLYITQNKSLKELTEILNRSKSNVRKLLERFNIPAKTQEMRDAIREENLTKLYEDEERVKEIVKKTQKTIRETYGNSWYRKTASKPELEIVAAIEEAFPDMVVNSGDYSVIRNPNNGAAFQLDIYMPEISLAIEFNGEYWHDKAAYEKDLKNGTCESREALKDKACADKNIMLWHLWDGEYKNDKVEFLTNVISRIQQHHMLSFVKI